MTAGGWMVMALDALVLVSIGFQLCVMLMMWRFFAGAGAPARSDEAVTLLKPLHGIEPLLVANLGSFLVQDHAGAVQMVCGIGAPGDAAQAGFEALRRAHPQADLALTIGNGQRTANGKMGNLITIMPQARHDVLVLSDSDMVAGPDYLARVLGALAGPGVGAVSCLYVGRGDSGLWSDMSAAAISYATMPALLLAAQTGLARPCMGSTIALRRETLDAIGGFGAFSDILADDFEIGEAVRRQGLRVAIPPFVITHACHEPTLGELWRHQLRWAATLRTLATAGYACTFVTNPVPLALLALVLAPVPGAALLAAAVAVRLALACQVDRIAGKRCAPLWLVPLGDCFGFAIYVASFFARKIDWRGLQLTMARDGRITAPE